MPRRSQKELEKLSTQAFELLDSGLTQAEVAEHLGVSLRSVQRWIAARSSTKKAASKQQVTQVLDKPIKDKELSQSNNQIPVKTPIKERINLKAYFKGLIDFSQNASNWGKLVDKTLEHHYCVHTEIAESLHLKLIDELSKPDASIRNINLLSLTLVRHLDNVQKNLFLGNETPMNVSRAMAILHAYGKCVVEMEVITQSYEQQA